MWIPLGGWNPPSPLMGTGLRLKFGQNPTNLKDTMLTSVSPWHSRGNQYKHNPAKKEDSRKPISLSINIAWDRSYKFCDLKILGIWCPKVFITESSTNIVIIYYSHSINKQCLCPKHGHIINIQKCSNSCMWKSSLVYFIYFIYL